MTTFIDDPHTSYGVIDRAAALVGSRRLSRRRDAPMPGATKRMIALRRARSGATASPPAVRPYKGDSRNYLNRLFGP